MSRRIFLIFRMNFPNFQCNSIVLFLLCLRICYKGTICILFPFSKQQMKSFSTFCQPLKGNRGVVCTVTSSTDPHTGLGIFECLCILMKFPILQNYWTCWRKTQVKIGISNARIAVSYHFQIGAASLSESY